jgi:hypothetical protein
MLVGLVGTLVVGSATVIAVIGLLATRRVVRANLSQSHNDIASYLFAAVGVIYAVLLAWVVVVVWQRYSDSNQAVVQEAAAAVVAYRDTQTFPEPQRQQAQQALRDYIDHVLTTEWRAHHGVIPHDTPDLLNPLREIYWQVQPNADQSARQAAAEADLHELEHQRHLRHLAGASTLPSVFWWVLIPGAILTIGFSYFFHLQNLRVHALMTGLLTASMVGVLFLIFTLDKPFAGLVQVSQTPLRHALEQFHAIDLI